MCTVNVEGTSVKSGRNAAGFLLTYFVAKSPTASIPAIKRSMEGLTLNEKKSCSHKKLYVFAEVKVDYLVSGKSSNLVTPILQSAHE